ncbi:calcium/calmodulin-dependent protein kinase [Myxozyma melibiosi]|uniref:Calcium/calmodulin-dependent protein kinase n=1 Tax=Myxozyma melibiosi TaxID=54550 RepID=A0ABR1F201_9ASCO
MSSSPNPNPAASAMSSHLYSIYGKLSNQPSSYDRKGRYRFGRVLGAGTYGIVKAATVIETGENVAVKVILKKKVQGHESMVQEELDLLRRLKHPHIVGFRDWFESKDKYYIVTQLATGGELFDRIVERGKYTEKDAVQTIKEVLEAVDYLHDLNIVHRDLKPENLLYLTPDADSQLVLADFGIAKVLKSEGEALTTMAGSFGYAAPEILLRIGHGKPCDIWSLGVITYTILCGYLPFRSENVQEYILEVRENGVIFHDKYWSDISSDAKDFIRGMLQVDPLKRRTSRELLKHKWIVGDTATTTDLLPNIREGFNARSKLLQAIEAVRLANKIKALGFDDDDEDAFPSSGVPSVFATEHSDDSSAAGKSDFASGGGSNTLGLPQSSSRRSSFGSKGNATMVFQEVVRSVSRIKSASNLKAEAEAEADAKKQ